MRIVLSAAVLLVGVLSMGMAHATEDEAVLKTTSIIRSFYQSLGMDVTRDEVHAKILELALDLDLGGSIYVTEKFVGFYKYGHGVAVEVVAYLEGDKVKCIRYLILDGDKLVQKARSARGVENPGNCIQKYLIEVK